MKEKKKGGRPDRGETNEDEDRKKRMGVQNKTGMKPEKIRHQTEGERPEGREGERRKRKTVETDRIGQT